MPGSPAISLKRAARLVAKKYREAERLFLAEGEALVRESTEPPRRQFAEPEEVRRLSTLTTPIGPSSPRIGAVMMPFGSPAVAAAVPPGMRPIIHAR